MKSHYAGSNLPLIKEQQDAIFAPPVGCYVAMRDEIYSVALSNYQDLAPYLPKSVQVIFFIKVLFYGKCQYVNSYQEM